MPTKKHDIFLSYSSKDWERVRPIVEVFEAQGWKVWWDGKIGVGGNWNLEISKALKNSSVVVVIWSTYSVDSEWVYEEANYGKKKDILIPVSIDLDEPPLGFTLIQAANLVGWKKGKDSGEMTKLLQHLQRFLPQDIDVSKMEEKAPFQEKIPTIIIPPKPKSTLPNHEMIKVAGGTFMMGSENGYDREKPVHQVTLSDYYIGKYPVTQALWKAIMGNNPSRFKGDNLPVDQLSWDDCQEFIKKLNEKTGEEYRLPTEAEWEFAARGGNLTKGFEYAGDNDLAAVGWYSDNSNNKTRPVGKKKANELGIYDMSGNVWEWCYDWYSNKYYETVKDGITNPRGPEKGDYDSRVLRGGSWISLNLDCRVFNRGSINPDYRYYYFDGFRLAQD